jgi:hypothetical protein
MCVSSMRTTLDTVLWDAWVFNQATYPFFRFLLLLVLIEGRLFPQYGEGRLRRHNFDLYESGLKQQRVR